MSESAQRRSGGPLFHSLDGEWDFFYQPQEPDYPVPAVPSPDGFTAKMKVPAYWDDCLESVKENWGDTLWLNPKSNFYELPLKELPPEPSLPFLMGIGWSRRIFEAPAKGRRMTLCVGGSTMEAWCWLNGEYVGYHLGHSTPFEMSLDKHLRHGERNELIIAVANTRTDRRGSQIRGFKGQSGGLSRSVFLHETGFARIANAYFHTSEDLSRLYCRVAIDTIPGDGDVSLDWRILDPETGQVLREGSLDKAKDVVEWTTDAKALDAWSDRVPRLYEMALLLRCGDQTLDALTQTFGARRLACHGTKLKLNGLPIYLRGCTEHCYFPLTCTVPTDVSFYRDIIRRFKDLGYNWLRCHTWTPPEEYLTAADQMGILIQVEAPVNAGAQEWDDILLTCRKHPSVVIYCEGNEQILDEEKIEQLRMRAERVRDLVPDALFNPQEGLRGVEYGEPDQLGADAEEKPFPHNRRRLELLKEFSDVFGQYSQGDLSYHSVDGDWRTIDAGSAMYERPCLSHENGIQGSYMNPDLEHRYEHTRIGTHIYAALRRYLTRLGLLDRASIYFRNSCAWMKILRKHNIETARKCRLLAGYDFLGAIDCHWHRYGYPCGIMNEFYEMKPGECVEDVVQYNGESVLLLDHGNHRNLTAGQTLRQDIMVSLFGPEDLEKGTLAWVLQDSGGRIWKRGEMHVENVVTGEVTTLGTIEFAAPDIDAGRKLALKARLSGDHYELRNEWNFWVFPSVTFTGLSSVADKGLAEKYGLRPLGGVTPESECISMVVPRLTEKSVDFMVGGGSVVLLGHEPFPTLPTRFQISRAGRFIENLATVIEDHWITRRFPHEGFCDWQFYPMLEGGCSIVFDDLDIPFAPIIDVASSFKWVRKQGALFELGVGKGRLIVCTLNLRQDDPAALFLLRRILQHAENRNYRPSHSVLPADLLKVRGVAAMSERDAPVDDEAADPNALK